MNTQGLKPFTFLLLMLPLIAACQPESSLFSHRTDSGPSPEHPRTPPILIDREEKPPRAEPPPEVEEEDPYYATDLFLHGGCEQNPTEFAVARQHNEPALCEHVIATPVMGTNGDLTEIGLPVTWGIDDTKLLALDCQGQDKSHCGVHGRQDIFDLDGKHEPAAVVIACVENTCPEYPDADCSHAVCRSTLVRVALNLEGAWMLQGAALNEQVETNLKQDGRRFVGDRGLKDGVVQNTHVKFRIDDYEFEGHVAPDRNSMNGDVLELLTYSYVGTWSATRLTTL